MFDVCRERCAPSYRAREGAQMVYVESWCVRGVMLSAGIGGMSIGGDWVRTVGSLDPPSPLAHRPNVLS